MYAYILNICLTFVYYQLTIREEWFTVRVFIYGRGLFIVG